MKRVNDFIVSPPTPACFLGLLLVALAVTLNVSLAQAGQNVVVLLDDSGSMRERMRGQSQRKIDAAKSALLIVLKGLPDDSKLGLFALNGPSGDGEWIIPLGPVNESEIDSAVNRIRTESGTPLGRFMKTTADELLKLRAEDRFGTYRLLIVTDGEANDAELVSEYLPQILNRGLTVDVIGVDMATDHSLATQASSYRRANDPKSLQTALAEVLAETGGDYQDDTDESAYELIASLPEELCGAVIAALAISDNQPIGESTAVYRGDQGLRPDWPGAANKPSSSKNNSNQPDRRTPRIPRFMVSMAIFFLIVVAMSLFSAMGKRRR